MTSSCFADAYVADVGRAAQVGLRALATATAASAVTVGAVVAAARVAGITSVRGLFHDCAADARAWH